MLFILVERSDLQESSASAGDQHNLLFLHFVNTKKQIRYTMVISEL